MRIEGKDYRTVWMEHDVIRMINQPILPHRFEIIDLKDHEQVYDAIRTMIVRGAPAIGATAAYGIAQAVLRFKGETIEELRVYLAPIQKRICEARPTAYDLFHGVAYVTDSMKSAEDVSQAKSAAKKAAADYADMGVDSCRRIGEAGNTLIKDGFGILTHCNAGALATVDYGTALAPIRAAHAAGKKIFVYADETRPRSQGSRLTAFELSEEGIPHAVIADNAAGYFLRSGKIDVCIVGSDRVAANGDVANKIGTYEKAVLAHENNVPFYVAIPLSTIDLMCPSGDKIPIEERSEDEVLYSWGWNDSGRFERIRIAPQKSSAKNPAFDVTPARYVTGLITPKGIINADRESIRRLFS